MPRRRTHFVDAGTAVVLLALMAIVLTSVSDAVGEIGRMQGARISVRRSSSVHGAATLVFLPGDATVLIDPGPDPTLVSWVEETLGERGVSRMDVVVVTAPLRDRYAGLAELMGRYAVGAVLYNGRADTANKTDWRAFLDTLTTHGIPLVTVGAGDRIRQGDAQVDVRSPDAVFAKSPDPAETRILLRLASSGGAASLLYNEKE